MRRAQSSVRCPIPWPAQSWTHDYNPTALFDATINLVEDLTSQYNIDPKRRYTTGQSMGAMMSLGFGIRYTDGSSWPGWRSSGALAPTGPAERCTDRRARWQGSLEWVTPGSGTTRDAGHNGVASGTAPSFIRK
jgi:hypothetical protein